MYPQQDSTNNNPQPQAPLGSEPTPPQQVPQQQEEVSPPPTAPSFTPEPANVADIPKPPKNRNILLIVLVVVALIALGAGVYLSTKKDSPKKSNDTNGQSNQKLVSVDSLDSESQEALKSTTVDNPGFNEVSEWGIKIPRSGTPNLSYKIETLDGVETLYISTKELMSVVTKHCPNYTKDNLYPYYYQRYTQKLNNPEERSLIDLGIIVSGNYLYMSTKPGGVKACSTIKAEPTLLALIYTDAIKVRKI